MFKKPSTRRLALITIQAIIIPVVFGSWGRYHTDIAADVRSDAQDFKTATNFLRLKVGGQSITFKTIAGYAAIGLNKADSAQLFYTAYTTGNVQKPLTFAFNGGPGSSSLWLHMGAFGPARVVPGRVGYRNNPDTWLPFTDLVFIDPVGTGFSRPVNGTPVKHFYGYEADIKVFARFIQHYLQENNRLGAPLFLAGESYGAARAVGLANYLQDTLKIQVAGLTLVSPALNYQLISFKQGNNIPYVHYLSAYASTAHYHQRLKPVLQQLPLNQLQANVDRFAFGAYANFLAGYKPLAAIIDTLSFYTGLKKQILTKLNGRVTDRQFVKLLLDSNRQTGTFDSRDVGTAAATDPSELRFRASFLLAFQNYLAQQLRYQNRLLYLPTIPTPAWNCGSALTDGYFSVIPTLQKLLKKNRKMRVHVVNGDYDLTTPPATVMAAVGNLAGPQLIIHHYKAGHMLFMDDKANAKCRTDSEAFYSQTLGLGI